MKEINSHHVEFGYELLSVIPYAYYHHLNGTLGKTISGKNTNDLYFFSQNHEEINKPRHGINNGMLNVPNSKVHNEFDFSEWVFPNYKEQFREEGLGLFGYENLVIISNKYNYEWKQDPSNYIHPQTLDIIFEYLTKKNYTIIYNRLVNDMGYDDGVECLELGDFDLIKEKHPQVITIQHLMEHYGLGLNELQMRLYATCNKFISVQGGTSIISSMFGGNNIILSNKGNENISGIYKNVFPKMSNIELTIIGSQTHPDGKIDYEKSQVDLLNKIQELY